MIPSILAPGGSGNNYSPYDSFNSGRFVEYGGPGANIMAKMLDDTGSYLTKGPFN